METLISKLPYDKVKINWNKKPIAISLFKTFLTVELHASTNHLGYYNGWTEYRNDDIKLIVGGGILNLNGKNVDLLDSIQYGKNLHNPYNNYVNPFYLKDIMTKDGLSFFKDYYKYEIQQELSKLQSEIERLEKSLTANKEKYINFNIEVDAINS